MDRLKAGSHVPIVEGARSWSNNSGVVSACSSATSSIESPPASIEPTTESTFVPQFAPWQARRLRAWISLASPSSEIHIAQQYVDRCVAEHVSAGLSVVAAAKAKWWTTEL